MIGLNPICPYCKKFSVLATGKEIYPHRKDLFKLKFYLCAECDAYVGTHKGTEKPLGRLANKELRKAKGSAHRAFDPLWLNKEGEARLMKRKEAYIWLAGVLNIEKDDCHIGMFDIGMCKDTVIYSLNKMKEVRNDY